MSVDARIEIVLGDGTALEHRVARETVVGSSERAHIRVPSSSGLSGEHLRIEPRDDGVQVAPIAGTQVLIGGVPHPGGLVPFGTEIRAGTASLRVVRADAEEKRGASPVMVLGVPAILIALLVVLTDGSEPVSAGAPTEPPALFDAQHPCETGAGTTRHRAEQDEHAARAKEERYPFAPGDGVHASALYRRASSCFESAGDGARASALVERAERVEHRVEHDYRTSRFRLERALEQQRWDEALAETRRLRALVAHRSGPYVQWLADLERRLNLIRDRRAEP